MKTQRRDEGFGLLIPWFLFSYGFQITGVSKPLLSQDQSLKLKGKANKREYIFPVGTLAKKKQICGLPRPS